MISEVPNPGVPADPEPTLGAAQTDTEPAVERRNLPDVVTGVLFAAFGAFVLATGSGLALFSDITIGPGMLPKAMGVAMLALGIALAVIGWRTKLTTKFQGFDRGALVRVGGTLGTLLVLVVLLEPLGFILATYLFLGLTFFLIQRKFTKASFIMFAVLPPLCWFLFAKLLSAPLPEGLLWF
jgi:putative tricarboxylic transport membrane protein